MRIPIKQPYHGKEQVFVVAHFGEVYIVFQSSILAGCPLNMGWTTSLISKEMLLPQKIHLLTPISGSCLLCCLFRWECPPHPPSTGPKHFHGPSNRASRRHRHRPSRPFQRVPSTARRPMCSSPLQEGRITKEPM